MTTLLIFLPIILFSFLESTVFSFPVALLFILSWAGVKSGKSSYLTAFLAGVLIDLLTLRTLGTTALVFLGLTFLHLLYQRKYTSTHLSFFLPVAVLSVILYQFIFFKKIELWIIVTAFILTIIIRFYVVQVFLRFSNPDQMKLEI